MYEGEISVTKTDNIDDILKAAQTLQVADLVDTLRPYAVKTDNDSLLENTTSLTTSSLLT